MLENTCIPRVLVYWPENELRPCGGPSGYLFSLSHGLREIGYSVDFLPARIGFVGSKIKMKMAQYDCLANIHRLLKLKSMCSRSSKKPDNLESHDMIHFHSTQDLFEAREWIDDFGGKVLLTSHTPCAPHIEKLDWITGRLIKRVAEMCLRLGLESVDAYAFSRADYIVFPTEEAEEPYRNTWEAYDGITAGSKKIYMTTGCASGNAKVSRQTYRRGFGIPDDAFVVSYVGRHNEVKGYKDLKRFAEKYLTCDEKTWFLIGGKEHPYKGLDHPRWIEVGWTDDPHSLIAASDVFVLPNRETYFDLVLLEVMSLGIPVVASRTGGNKYFDTGEECGVLLYGDADELKRKLDDLRDDRETARALGQKNKKTYLDEFTERAFAERYKQILSWIAHEND